MNKNKKDKKDKKSVKKLIKKSINLFQTSDQKVDPSLKDVKQIPSPISKSKEKKGKSKE